MQRRRELPLLFGQVAVARRSRQTVVLARGLGEDELHRNVEIANHAIDDRALLRIFASEDCEFRLDDVE